MDKLAAFLIEKETITGKEFMETFRREKGTPEPEKKEESGVNKAGDAEKSVEEKAEEEMEQSAEDKAQENTGSPVEEKTIEEDKTPDEGKDPEGDQVTDSPSKEEQSGDESDEGSLGLFSGSRLK